MSTSEEVSLELLLLDVSKYASLMFLGPWVLILSGL
jgi:hypothetical protein